MIPHTLRILLGYDRLTKSKGIDLRGGSLDFLLLQRNRILVDRATGCTSLANEKLLVGELWRSTPTFSRVISPPRMSQRIQPLPYFNFKL